MRARLHLGAVVAAFALFGAGCGIAGNQATVSAFALRGGEDRDPEKTPGDLCTDEDPDFDEYRYREQIAHCARHVTSSQKRAVGQAYGVDPEDFSDYQFDHFIPLSIGGSNSNLNLWPMIVVEARRKAAFEQQLYLRISRGEITQARAIQEITDWR